MKESYYSLSKEQRARLAASIQGEIRNNLRSGQYKEIPFFSDEDTYVRKAAYLAIGKIHKADQALEPVIIQYLEQHLEHDHFHIRQTAVNAAGEIGKIRFAVVQHFFDRGLFDPHHTVRNAVIGSIKKMGEVNPEPVLSWARQYLHHADKEIRREICHGIELRGRKYPQDILPLLKDLQSDRTARVRNTLIHVLGQIAYKKGCLETVITDLKTWENKALVEAALEEIMDVHDRYKDFAVLTQAEAKAYIVENYPGSSLLFS